MSPTHSAIIGSPRTIDETLLKRSAWFVRIRLVAGATVILVFGALKITGGLDFPFLLFALAPIVAMAINQPYPWLVKRVKNHELLFLIHQSLDILIITWGIHFAGGMNLFPTVLAYPLVFVFTGIVLGPRRTYLMANLSFAMYAAMIALESSGRIPVVSTVQVNLPGHDRLIITLLVLPFFNLIAFVSTYLSHAVRRSEASLSRSQQMLRLVLDHMPARVFWKNRDSRYIGCNQICAQDLGLRATGEILGKTDFDLAWKDRAEKYRSDDRKVMDEEAPKLNYEEMARTPGGGEIWVRTSKLPLRDSRGQVAGVLGIYEDITNQKKAEESIKQSEATLRAVTAAAQDAIIMMDADGNISFWNDAAERIFGWSKEEALGKPLHQFLAAERFLEPYQRAFPHFQATGEGAAVGRTVELWGRRKDHKEIPVELSMSAVQLGERWHAVGIARDMTERLRSEEELRKLKRAVEQSPNCVVITDRTGAIEYVNPSFSVLTGYSFEDVRGQNPRVLKSGEQPAEFYKDLWETISSGREWRGEFHNKKKNGDLYWEFASISPVRNTNGEITHFIAIKDNITARKEAEEKIRRANLKLEEQALGLIKTNETIRAMYKELESKTEKLKSLDKLKSEFVSTVSHELRTPLTIIKEGAALVYDKILGEINPDQKETLKDVLGQVERLSNIINGLLDISKLEAGKVKLEFQALEPAELIQNVVRSFQVKAKSKSIGLSFEPSEGMLPKVEADEEKLVQILTNLVGNAVKFTPENGKIVIRAKESGGEVEISVSDTGPGVTEDNLLRLFNKFEQFGRTAGPGEKGTGLGLAITKELVQLHGGRIWAESKVGEGSTFRFTVLKHEAPDKMCRHRLKRVIDEMESVRSKAPLSVAILRVKNMHQIKSLLGEEACATVFDSIEKIAKGFLTRHADQVARYSENELMFCLGNTDELGAYSVIKRIREGIASARIFYGSQELVLNIGCGVGSYPKSGATAEEIVQFAMAELNRRRKVMIVDDHPQIIQLLQNRFQKEHQMETCGASTGEECLAKVEQFKPDLIILDVVLPKMSGYEVMGRLKERKDTKDIPIIVLTAHQVELERVQGVGPGDIPVVGKTEGFENIVKIVNNMI